LYPNRFAASLLAVCSIGIVIVFELVLLTLSSTSQEELGAHFNEEHHEFIKAIC